MHSAHLIEQGGHRTRNFGFLRIVRDGHLFPVLAFPGGQYLYVVEIILAIAAIFEAARLRVFCFFNYWFGRQKLGRFCYQFWRSVVCAAPGWGCQSRSHRNRPRIVCAINRGFDWPHGFCFLYRGLCNRWPVLHAQHREQTPQPAQPRCQSGCIFLRLSFTNLFRDGNGLIRRGRNRQQTAAGTPGQGDPMTAPAQPPA